MRILSNSQKVFGYDELMPEAKTKARKILSDRKQYSEKVLNRPYYLTVNDFEFFENGLLMFYTNNINAC